MCKFKCGDKILVVDNHCYHSYPVGLVLTIKEVNTVFDNSRYYVLEGCSYLLEKDFVPMLDIKIL